MENEPVLFYGGKFGCFSNMAGFAVEIDGVVYMTSEHAYQSAKFSDQGIKNKIINARSGMDAKKVAIDNSEFVIPEWHTINLEVMENILRKKLEQHAYIQEKLIETGKREIIEASPHDAYWGWGPDKKGLNMHGKLWMKIRSEFVK